MLYWPLDHDHTAVAGALNAVGATFDWLPGAEVAAGRLTATNRSVARGLFHSLRFTLPEPDQVGIETVIQ